MKKENLLAEFKDNLQRVKNSDVRHIYKLLFELLGDESLDNMLSNAFDDFKSGYDWFPNFHKSIRQWDIFTEIHAYKEVDKLTPEQRERRNELLAIRRAQYDEFKREHPDAENLSAYRAFNKTPERVETFNELRELNSIMATKDDIRIGGILDAILYCIISIDADGDGGLYQAMKRTFKICS